MKESEGLNNNFQQNGEELPQNITPTTEKEKKNKKTWLLIPAIMALLLIGAVIAMVVFVKQNFDYNYNKISNKPEDLGFQEVISEKTVNIALFGIDTRNENSFKGRSDSIMILSVDTATDKIKLISVMRDSFVPIEYNGKTSYSKINSAYSKGGPELAIKTLNTVFGLDISEYATVNFYGMADIIDAVGGIEVELTKSEINYVNGGVREQCNYTGEDPNEHLVSSAGVQHLDGVQAVAYSRIRYTSNADGTSNDYGRTDRQRYVLGQLFEKAKNMDKSKYSGLIKALMPCCETSLSYTEILELAMNVMLEAPTFEQTRVPDTEYTMKAPTTSAGSIVYYDLNFAAKLIHSFIYDGITPEEYIEKNGVEKNNWYKNGYTPPTFLDETAESSSSK